MFSHIMIGGDDLSVSKKFYDATFAAIGVVVLRLLFSFYTRWRRSPEIRT